MVAWTVAAAEAAEHLRIALAIQAQFITTIRGRLASSTAAQGIKLSHAS